MKSVKNRIHALLNGDEVDTFARALVRGIVILIAVTNLGDPQNDYDSTRRPVIWFQGLPRFTWNRLEG